MTHLRGVIPLYSFNLKHDLFGKPVPTFPDHARRGPHHTKIALFWRGPESHESAAKFLPQPNFRSFSNRFSQALACAATFFGAVPPKLVRLFTEASTDSTFSASAVIFGSIPCIAFSGSSCSATPSFDARLTMRPVT